MGKATFEPGSGKISVDLDTHGRIRCFSPDVSQLRIQEWGYQVIWKDEEELIRLPKLPPIPDGLSPGTIDHTYPQWYTAKSWSAESFGISPAQHSVILGLRRDCLAEDPLKSHWFLFRGKETPMDSLGDRSECPVLAAESSRDDSHFAYVRKISAN